MKQVFLLFVVLLAIGCGDDGDVAKTDTGGPDVIDRCDQTPTALPGSCSAAATDWVAGGNDSNSYKECFLNEFCNYSLAGESSPSSIARVEAFEDIATLLFDSSKDPSKADFDAARVHYDATEGLSSRVGRRYDPHVTPAGEVDCTIEAQATANPKYCVGPAILVDMIGDAFNGGSAENAENSRVFAATIEGALLRFLYASVAKESLTCTTKAKDCDSSWAYYNGGKEARGGIGLARYLNEVDAASHSRVWDGLIALRCWREADNETVATDLVARELAREQQDKALSRGLSSLVRDRSDKWMNATGVERDYQWAFLKALAPALEPTALAADATKGAELIAFFEAENSDAFDAAKVKTLISDLYPCP